MPCLEVPFAVFWVIVCFQNFLPLGIAGGATATSESDQTTAKCYATPTLQSGEEIFPAGITGTPPSKGWRDRIHRKGSAGGKQHVSSRGKAVVAVPYKGHKKTMYELMGDLYGLQDRRQQQPQQQQQAKKVASKKAIAEKKIVDQVWLHFL